MNKVYVVNHTTQNILSAKKYGKVEIVSNGNVPLFKTELMVKILRESLINFKEDDYLLLAGPVWLSVMASAMLFSKYNAVKFLVFDAKLQKYIVRHLSFDSYSLV